MANTYDRHDKVRRLKLLRAGPLKIAAYTVMDPETGEHGEVQYHMTYDNHVMALMSEEAAKLFANFVNDFGRTPKTEDPAASPVTSLDP